MRVLTEEQKAKRDARRARMRALAQEVSKLTEEQRSSLAKGAGVVTIDGRSLSLVNQCLVIKQNPSATLVGGFKQWLKAGRAVRKGESGSMIWVPLGHKETNPETGEVEINGVENFVIGTVFDVSQTIEIESGNGSKLQPSLFESGVGA